LDKPLNLPQNHNKLNLSWPSLSAGVEYLVAEFTPPEDIKVLHSVSYQYVGLNVPLDTGHFRDDVITDCMMHVTFNHGDRAFAVAAACLLNSLPQHLSHVT